MAGITVVLIGAGRWGRVHAGVLAGMSPRVERVLWVARHNKPTLDALSARAPRFEILDSLDLALRERPGAAVVVTQSADHAITAEALLSNGVPVLVEKPLALSTAGAERLIALAERHALVLCVGLHLLKADFLQRFRDLCANRSIVSLRVEWIDPAFETRYGETKSCNLSAHKADDAVPHLWSIIAMLQPAQLPLLRVARPQPRGAIALEIDIGPTRAVALLERRGEKRKRRVELTFSDGGSGVLDFTEVPGEITIDGIVRDQRKPDAEVPGPLAAEIEGFFDAVDHPHEAENNPQLARRCLGSVGLTEAVRERLMEEEARAAAEALAAGAPFEDPDVSAWIIDNVAPLLGNAGVRVLASDTNAQARVIETARQVLLGIGPGTGNGAASMGEDSRFLALVSKQLAQWRPTDRQLGANRRKPEGFQ